MTPDRRHTKAPLSIASMDRLGEWLRRGVARTRRRNNAVYAATLGTALLLLASPSAQAAPITQPMGLSPGDEYRLAFVTSSTRDAGSDDIGVYNQFVSNVAGTQSELANLGTTWTAIASTPSVNAKTTTNTLPALQSQVPIFRLDGQLIASDYTDLWNGDLIRPLSIDESGETLETSVWTGTNADGSANSPNFQLGNTSFFFLVTSGTSSSASSSWVNGTPLDLGDQLSFYGISGTLRMPPVSVSLPGTLIMMSFGLVGLVGIRRRQSSTRQA